MQTSSLYYSAMWPVKETNSTWILTVHYHNLNEVVTSVASAVQTY